MHKKNPVEILNNMAALIAEAKTGAALDVVIVETEDFRLYDNRRKHRGVDH